MIKRYEKPATWANGLSFLGLLAALAFGVLTKHRFDPLPIILVVLGAAGVVGSSIYLDLKPKLSPERKKRELLGVVHFYPQLGFFAEYGDLTDEEAASKLNAKLRRTHRASFDPADPGADPNLLELDETRVWNSELECDVAEGNLVYAQILESLGAISRGAFSPQNIEETWETDKGPIRVQFTIDGVAHTLNPKYRKDWLDTDFLFKVAKRFQGTGYELAIRPGDPVYATVLTKDERRRIRRERGSVF